MELEEAIKILKYQLANRNTDVYTPINYEAMEVALNHITKQDKMIDLMAEDRMLPQGCRTLYNVFNKQDVIDFYEKFVEESE